MTTPAAKALDKIMGIKKTKVKASKFDMIVDAIIRSMGQTGTHEQQVAKALGIPQREVEKVADALVRSKMLIRVPTGVLFLHPEYNPSGGPPLPKRKRRLGASAEKPSSVLAALDQVTKLQAKLLKDTEPVEDSPVLSALAQVTEAAEGLLSAAKDSGDSKKDKDRATKVQELVAMAETLCENVDLKGFPEAKAACDAVLSLKDMNTKLTEAQIKLKAAPGNTEEAQQAQETIDALRGNLDTMLPPLEATMKTMETLLMAASALEEQFAMMSEQVKGLEDKLKADKERLAAISKAVEQAAKIG